MTQVTVHRQVGLVDVTYRPDLNAVNLVWHAEYDEGTGVRDAVLAAAAYAKAHEVKGWLADISHSRSALSPSDLDWVNGDEFRNAIKSSGLTRFVLVPPLPETGQDTSWLDDWEKNTLAAFGAGVEAKIIRDPQEVHEFLTTPTRGENA